MTKKILYLLGIVITILVGTYFYLSCCSCCGTMAKDGAPIKEEVKAPVIPEATSFPFAFRDGDYVYENQDNINFKGSGFTILEPISPNVDAGIFSLKKHLENNADKAMDITGFYTSDEANDSAFPNLGLARANAAKNYFVSKGMSSSRINTIGTLKDAMVAKDDMFLGPLMYSITTKTENSEEELKALAIAIKDDPLVLYFNTGEAAINLSMEQRQKVADISRYLDKVEGATCSLVGHSDNTGNRVSNIELGLDRANFAKGYLVKNGILASRISTSSKGPDFPIASNDTEEGRAKNRRTVVTLN